VRRYAVLAALLALPAGRLRAQHAGQFEAGVFGGYTRYDAALGLAHKLGGGGRLGYFFGDAFGLEADVLFQPEYTVVRRPHSSRSSAAPAWCSTPSTPAA